tara:strand:- start:1112 stop:1342 length:231 start_codon:yes stop_codon:yes gene_type:complete
MGLEVFIEADEPSDLGHTIVEDVGDNREVFLVNVTVDAHQIMERVNYTAKLVLMREYVSSSVVFDHRNRIFLGRRL